MRRMVRLSRALALLMLTAVPVLRANGQGSSERSSIDRRSDFFIGMMRRMDANRNGSLEQHEISSRARPYVDRVARSAGLNTSCPLSIRAMEEDEESPAEVMQGDRPSHEERRDDGPGNRQEDESRGPYGDRSPSQPWRFDDRREEYRRGPPSGRWSGRRGRD
jgi:hypothetical protein